MHTKSMDQTAQPEWERKLELALEDVKAGRVQHFKSNEEFLPYLQGTGKKPRTRKKAA